MTTATLDALGREIGPTDKRDVTFHLSPYAPGCADVQVNDRRRALTIANRRPGQALHQLIERLGLRADLVAVDRLDNGETVIHGARQPDRIYAFIWHGLTFEETRRAHEGLTQRLATRGHR